LRIFPIGIFCLLGYIKNNQSDKAINLFNEIKNPDEVILILLFNACAQLGKKELLNFIKKVWNEMPKSFLDDNNLCNSLIDALMKCGDVENAQTLFDKSLNKTLFMYGSMMKG
jgi:pentatricopeptide repeat protein